MQVNELPKVDMSTSETGCCPLFDPVVWDEQEFVFENKQFVKKSTIDFLHMPLNMGSVMKNTAKKIDDAGAGKNDFVVLSNSSSLWKTDHYFSVTREVPDCENVTLSGNFLSKVFEGPYRDAGKWAKEAQEYVESQGKKVNKLFYYYTTCPKCVKHYKKNYVVVLAQV